MPGSRTAAPAARCWSTSTTRRAGSWSSASRTPSPRSITSTRPGATSSVTASPWRSTATGSASFMSRPAIAPRVALDSRNSAAPSATKGRVERANGTLQDRLVKELRLRGLSSIAAAEPFLPTFTADYNARFAKPARSPHDAHRPLHPSEELPRIFTLQETRRISAQLTVHYKRGLYVLEDCVDHRRLRRT